MQEVAEREMDRKKEGERRLWEKAQPGKSDYPAHCVLARLNNLIPYI